MIELENLNAAYRLRAFGHTLASNQHLGSWPGISTGQPDLTLFFTHESPFGWEPEGTPPAFLSQVKSADGRSLISLFLLEDYKVLRYMELVDFYIFPEKVVCHLHQDLPAHFLNALVFVKLLPFWLELRGFATLHASVLVRENQAIAFLAQSRNGKSTLAAALLQDGYRLLSDDVLPICLREDVYWAYPGYPMMRLWPDEAEHFLGQYEGLEQVRPDLSKRNVPMDTGETNKDSFSGVFCDTPCAIKCLYLIERRDDLQSADEIQIRSISWRNAVIELLRYLYSPRLVEAAGLAPERFEFFAGLVRRIPVRRLIYPSGYEYLPLVRQAILADG